MDIFTYAMAKRHTDKAITGTQIGNEFEQYHRRTRKDILTIDGNADLSKLWLAIEEQNLEKYGMTLGDYFIGASGYEYILADMDSFYGGYDSYAVVNTHHIGVVVNTKQTVRWNEVYTAVTGSTAPAWKADTYYTYDSENDSYTVQTSQPADWATDWTSYYQLSNTTASGYVGSTLHQYLSGDVLTNIRADIATITGDNAEHLLQHQKYLTTNAGTSGAWSKQYISALTEEQIYGTKVWGNSGGNVFEAFKLLNVFSKYRPNFIFGNRAVWLRTVYSTPLVTYLHNYGVTNTNGTSSSFGAVGLILLH